MREPIFSIIIPAYNAERFIERCIDSVCAEKREEQYEVIVVDDGSTDATRNILDRKASGKKNMQVIYSENKGVSHARNEALRRAEGKFILFLDADDYFLDGWYKIILDGIQKNCDLVVFDFVKKYENGKEAKVTYYLTSGDVNAFEYLFLTSNQMNPCWSRIYLKKIIEENNIHFDETVSIGEDFLFTLEYFKYCKNINVVHTPFLYKEERENSVMNNIDVLKYMKDDSLVLNARLQYMKYLPCTNDYAEECYLLHFKAITNLLLKSIYCHKYNKSLINKIICSKHTEQILDNVYVARLPLSKKIEYVLMDNQYTNLLYIYLKVKSKFLFVKRNDG